MLLHGMQRSSLSSEVVPLMFLRTGTLYQVLCYVLGFNSW